MADKKETAPIEQIKIEEPIKEEELIKAEKPIKKESKKVKVRVIANIKYGEVSHVIGDKILILASEVKEFEALKVVEKLVFEKDENEVGE